jgi:hypothetical protein
VEGEDQAGTRGEARLYIYGSRTVGPRGDSPRPCRSDDPHTSNSRRHGRRTTTAAAQRRVSAAGKLLQKHTNTHAGPGAPIRAAEMRAGAAPEPAGDVAACRAGMMPVRCARTGPGLAPTRSLRIVKISWRQRERAQQRCRRASRGNETAEMRWGGDTSAKVSPSIAAEENRQEGRQRYLGAGTASNDGSHTGRSLSSGRVLPPPQHETGRHQGAIMVQRGHSASRNRRP